MTAEPSLALVAPAADEGYADALRWMGTGDWSMPSTSILWALEHATGVDPVAWVAQELAGDWRAFACASSALAALEDFHARTAAALREQITALGEGWEGPASQAAQARLTALAVAVQAQEEPLADARRACHQVATSIVSFAGQAQSALAGMVDLAAVWLASQGAAVVAAAAPGVGPAVAALMQARALKALASLVRLWYLLLEAHGVAMEVLNLSVGAMAGAAGALRQFATVPVPLPDAGRVAA